MRTFFYCPAIPTRRSQLPPLPGRTRTPTTSNPILTARTGPFGLRLQLRCSGEWSAIECFPFAPPPGQFTGSARPRRRNLPTRRYPDDGSRGTASSIPGPLRFRAYRHDQKRSRHCPPNPLALPISPAGVTGIFPSHRSWLSITQPSVTGDRRRNGRLELQRPRPGAIRRYIFPAAIDGWDLEGLPDLRRTAGRASHLRERYLQFDVALPELDDRPRLARAICVHGAGFCGAFFGAHPAGAMKFLRRRT